MRKSSFGKNQYMLHALHKRSCIESTRLGITENVKVTVLFSLSTHQMRASDLRVFSGSYQLRYD